MKTHPRGAAPGQIPTATAAAAASLVAAGNARSLPGETLGNGDLLDRRARRSWARQDGVRRAFRCERRDVRTHASLGSRPRVGDTAARSSRRRRRPRGSSATRLAAEEALSV